MLFHESTMLRAEDRKGHCHSTLREAIDVAKAAGVTKELFAFHISSRYAEKWPEFIEQVRREEDVPFRIILVEPGKVHQR